MRQGKPNYFCRSVGIRDRYCTYSNSGKKLLVIPVRMILRLAAGSLFAAWRVSFALAKWHPSVLHNILVSLHPPTHNYTHTFTRIRAHSQIFTDIHTHSNTFTHIHTHSQGYTHIPTHIHAHTFKHTHTCSHTHACARAHVVALNTLTAVMK